MGGVLPLADVLSNLPLGGGTDCRPLVLTLFVPQPSCYVSRVFTDCSHRSLGLRTTSAHASSTQACALRVMRALHPLPPPPPSMGPTRKDASSSTSLRGPREQLLRVCAARLVAAMRTPPFPSLRLTSTFPLRPCTCTSSCCCLHSPSPPSPALFAGFLWFLFRVPNSAQCALRHARAHHRRPEGATTRRLGACRAPLTHGDLWLCHLPLHYEPC